MSLINIKIEGIPYKVEEGLTILEAAKACGYEIPSLCLTLFLFLKSIFLKLIKTLPLLLLLFNVIIYIVLAHFLFD